MLKFKNHYYIGKKFKNVLESLLKFQQLIEDECITNAQIKQSRNIAGKEPSLTRIGIETEKEKKNEIDRTFSKFQSVLIWCAVSIRF